MYLVLTAADYNKLNKYGEYKTFDEAYAAYIEALEIGYGKTIIVKQVMLEVKEHE